MSIEPFERDQKLWVHGLDGTSRPAIYVGCDDRLYGGATRAYVVFEDTHRPGQVAIDRITARDDDQR